MEDYFATQRTGTACAPFNCAAASGAMGLAAGSGNEIKLTADEFRLEANVSCKPGEHSQSGGLFISDVIRVFRRHGMQIDYGQQDDPPGYQRWAPAELSRRCGAGEGAVLLGDYDALPKQYRALSTFFGDHSAWVHDYRESNQSICWHDPLRKVRLRIPITAAISYWQKPSSPIRGYAGFVKIKEVEGEVGVHINITGRFDGTARVTGSGHSYILVADSSLHAVPDGWPGPQGKEVVYTGVLGKELKLSEATSFPAGTQVIGVGVGEAILLRKDVVLTPRKF